jgi:hypothetical protein
MTLTELQSDSVRAIISLTYRQHAHTYTHTHTHTQTLNTYMSLFIKSLLYVTRILHHTHRELMSLAQNYLLIVQEMLLHWLLSK